MTKADELWEKYSYELAHDFNRRMSKDKFLAALAEYGKAVRDRDAEICVNRAKKSLIPTMVMANQDCAAAISREPLP